MWWGGHLGLPGTPPRWLCFGQMDGWRRMQQEGGWGVQEGFFFREGCNLIGGHSCVNRGIEEFCVGLMELTLHECPPPFSPPPKMGHFPHVSENMTTSPAKSESKAGSRRPARGKLHFFFFLRAVKFSFSPPGPSHPPPPSRPPPPPPSHHLSGRLG